jgi:hypothetical protein
MMDAFGPEGFNIADQFRAIVEVGGVMNDDCKCCAALLMEVEEGLTPPGIFDTDPDFKVDPDLLRKETRNKYTAAAPVSTTLFCHQAE